MRFELCPNKKMSNNARKPLAQLDYKPAKLYTPKKSSWEVKFWYRNSTTNKLKLFKRRVKPLKDEKERFKLGKQIENAINAELQNGWTPFKEGRQVDFIVDLLADFELHTNRKFESGEFRYDTKRSYLSNLSKFKRFLDAKDLNKLTTDHFDRSMITKYIDWLEFDLENSATTINNNVTVLKVICNYFIDRGLIHSNPVERIKRKREAPKKRTVIPDPILKDVFDYQKKHHYNFYVLMLTCHFCFLRTTELTKLKVKHINIEDGLIFVPADISKNRKDDFITIPDMFAKILTKHISKSQKEDYILKFRS